jgi:hypothetical protein
MAVRGVTKKCRAVRCLHNTAGSNFFIAVNNLFLSVNAILFKACTCFELQIERPPGFIQLIHRRTECEIRNTGLRTQLFCLSHIYITFHVFKQ